MHLMGCPLANSQQGMTQIQWEFLAEALPRIEMRKNGVDPDNPDKTMGSSGSTPATGDKWKGKSELTRLAQKKRAERQTKKE